MIRLNMVVEGQTEETFVRELLAADLAEHGVYAVARSIKTSRRRGRVYRGGNVGYAYLRNDVVKWLSEDGGNDARFTTMVDLYGLPSDFPGYAQARGRTLTDRVALLEREFQTAIGDPRFVPYIQVHEFEALLFSDPSRFSDLFPDRAAVQALVEIANIAESPEHIDDGRETAPCKRIRSHIPGFAKTSAGPLLARHIGLAKIEEQCKHFAEWMQRLRRLGD